MSTHRLYTADTHLFHNEILIHCPESRPFDNVSQMNDYMIECHNLVAESDSDIWILGDWMLGKDEKEARKFFDKMKGSKHLIVGNHDKKITLRLPWSSIRKDHVIVDEGRTIYLNHYPVISWPQMYKGAFHFYGHTHGKLPSRGKSIDVGVDSWNFQPITANQAIERMKEWNLDFETYAPERPRIIKSAADNQAADITHTPKIW